MKKFLYFVAAAIISLPMLASAHGPTRQQVKETIFIKAAPEKVWAILGDFTAIDKWHPAIKSVEMKDDKTRVLTLKAEGNPTITEELKKKDDKKMTLSYKITDMSVVKTIKFNGQDVPYYTLPVANYKSWIIVKPKNGGSEVTWKGKFYRSYLLNPPEPEGQSDADAVNTIKGVYTAGLNNLKSMMEK